MQSQVQPSSVESHYYQSNDALKLHYLLWPNPTTTACCLLLHGFTNDAHIWDALAQKLQQHYNVIALDFRGHGDSQWDPQARYTHFELLDDTFTLLSHLDFTDYHVVGHSLGARVAMLMFARKPITPSSFTIIDTGPEVRAVGVDKVRKDAENTPTHFASIDAFEQYLAGIYLFAQPERVRLMAEHGVKQNDQGEWVSKTDPAFTAALWKPDSYQGDSNDLRFPLNDELWMALAKVTSPSLILKGQASAILAKQTAENMAYHIMPNAELQVIKRAGHALMVDNPDAFEEAVLSFLQKQT